MSWIVRLEQQPCAWLLELAAADERLGHRVAAALDLLREYGLRGWPESTTSRAERADPPSGAGGLLFRFCVTGLPGRRTIRIVEAVAPPGLSHTCDIRFEPVPGLGQTMSSLTLPDAAVPYTRVTALPRVPLALRVAARFLPELDRARYAEEFKSELYEIAAAGGGRRQQLAYSCRLMLGALGLRAALSRRRPQRAVP